MQPSVAKSRTPAEPRQKKFAQQQLHLDQQRASVSANPKAKPTNIAKYTIGGLIE